MQDQTANRTAPRASGRLAIVAALVLAACASKQPEPVQPPLVLGYQNEAPRSKACDSLIGQAVERDANSGFKLVGMLVENVRPRPDAARVPQRQPNRLVPDGSHPAGLGVRQLDGTFRSLHVNCETRQAYVSKRGAVIDITYWYGPFGL